MLLVRFEILRQRTTPQWEAMFAAWWSWLLPLVGAAIVFSGVLLTTPPGFRALSDVLFGSPRGPSADAAAYALGAAASLALVTLLVLALLIAGIETLIRRGR
jgi:hypothetical protein